MPHIAKAETEDDVTYSLREPEVRRSSYLRAFSKENGRLYITDAEDLVDFGERILSSALRHEKLNTLRALDKALGYPETQMHTDLSDMGFTQIDDAIEGMGRLIAGKMQNVDDLRGRNERLQQDMKRLTTELNRLKLNAGEAIKKPRTILTKRR